MKTNSRGGSISKGGLGERLELFPDPWFLARVSAVDTDGGQNLYTLVEVQPVDDDYGYEDKGDGQEVSNAYEFNNATVAVDTIVLARPRAWAADGPTYEFQVSPPGEAGPAGEGIKDTVHVVAGPDWPGTPSDVFLQRVKRDGMGVLVVSSPPVTYGKPTPWALLTFAGTVGGPTGGTTAAADTTGATLIVAFVADSGGGATVTDSRGNTYTPLTGQTVGAVEGTLYYVANPLYDAAHTFTVVGTDASMDVAVFTGSGDSPPFDDEDGASAAGVSSLAAGTVTPSRSGDLFVTGAALGAAGSPTIDTGFTIVATQGYTGGSNVGSSLAYKIQAASSPESPTWTFAGSGDYAACLACFKVKPVGKVYEHADLPWRAVDPDDGTVTYQIPLFVDPSSGDPLVPEEFVGYVEWPEWYSINTFDELTNVTVVQNVDCTYTVTQTFTSIDQVMSFFDSPSLSITRSPTPPPPPP